MDPNELYEWLRVSAEIAVKEYEYEPSIEISDDHAEMAKKFLDLDKWIRNGGFLPEEWDK
jgi:hypothetical protein